MNDRPTVVVPAERYVNARELAEMMGVSTRTITRMVKDGMPSENWGLNRTRRFLPSRAMTWAHERATMRPHRDGVDDPPGQLDNRRE